MYDFPTSEDLRKVRLKLGLTQTELAKKAGVSQALIARIEAGNIDPRLSTLRKIFGALKEEGVKEISAGDVMKSPVIYISPEDTVGSISKLMDKHGISQLPVLKDGVQVGSLSEARVIKEMGLEKDLSKVSIKKVKDIMSEGFPTVGRNMDIKTISRMMDTNPAVLIVEKGEIKGIITKADILKLMR